MPNCAQCGRELPAFFAGEMTPLCPDCRRSALQPSPPEAQYTSVARPAPPQPVLTIALVAINVAVYVLMVVRGVSPISPTTGQLLQWGANFGPFALGGQPWRVFTSNYVHIGIIHIALNMWCLWNLGRLAERVFRPVTMFVVYTLCGIAGSVASLWWHPQGVGAGASGAIFGLAGAIITVLYLGKLPIPKQALQPILKSVVYFAVINLILGGTISGIDNSAHVGGLVMGLALGAVLGQVLMWPRDSRLRAELLTFAAATLLLLGSGWWLQRTHGEDPRLRTALVNLQKNQPDEAIATLAPLLQQHPDNRVALFLMGSAYTRKLDYAAAADSYQRLLALDPENRNALFLLSQAQLQLGQTGDAIASLEKLVRLDPDNPSLQGALGTAYVAAGRQQDADAAFAKAAHMSPAPPAHPVH